MPPARNRPEELLHREGVAGDLPPRRLLAEAAEAVEVPPPHPEGAAVAAAPRPLLVAAVEAPQIHPEGVAAVGHPRPRVAVLPLRHPPAAVAAVSVAAVTVAAVTVAAVTVAAVSVAAVTAVVPRLLHRPAVVAATAAAVTAAVATLVSSAVPPLRPQLRLPPLNPRAVREAEASEAEATKTVAAVALAATVVLQAVLLSGKQIRPLPLRSGKSGPRGRLSRWGKRRNP